VPPLRKKVTHLLHELTVVRGDVALELLARLHHDFRRGRRRGRAQIGHKIGNREVRFVAHAADHGNFRNGDRARDNLQVEGPQILKRSPAARDDHHVHDLREIEIPQSSHDLRPAPSPCTFAG
jgi:hypothetical protein